MNLFSKISKNTIFYLVNDALAVEDQKKVGHSWSQKWRVALQKAMATVKVWNERSKSRSQLAALSPRLQEDIGLMPSEVKKEIKKYFWQA